MSEDYKKQVKQEIAEVEADFNNKLKSQQSDLKRNETSQYRKYFIVGTALFFIIIPTIFVFRNTTFISSNTNLNTDTGVDRGYFAPNQFIGDEIEVVGKIDYVKDDLRETVKYEYALYENDTVKAFLESKDNNLSLSNGLNVKIQGELTGKYKDTNVINVDTIIIK